MRKQNDKLLALCLIVRGRKEEAEMLDKCLEYAMPYVDMAYITVTHKPGEDDADVLKVCDQYKNVVISHYQWNNNFADARNFNFSQVPKEYKWIVWIDADDGVRHMDKLRKVLEDNPDEDCFSLMYMYAFDKWKNPIVVHQKTQVVRNDGSFKWAGALHEDFTVTRDVKPPKLIEGIERIHLSNEWRFNDAKKRNLEVSLADLANNPQDPRSYWNVGNSQFSNQMYAEAIETFKEFMKRSKSDDEKYVAYLRIAEALMNIDQYNEAIDAGRYAIGLNPKFPDAYHTVGNIYLKREMWEKAIEMYSSGFSAMNVYGVPYHSIMVFNPREYDYYPMKAMARAYTGLGFPQLALILIEKCVEIVPDDDDKKIIAALKEASREMDTALEHVKKLKDIKDNDELKKEIDKLPDEIRSHPMVCNLVNTRIVRTTSTGKDISIFCGYTKEEWTPETARTKGIGGSEEAVIHLSELFSQRGWNVTVYNNCGYKELKFGNVSYKPFWTWNFRDKQDVVILWRSPAYAKYKINAKKVYVDLHDAIGENELTQDRLENINRIFVKSAFQRSLFPRVPDEKFVIVPNGIVPDLFKENDKDPMLVINTSSPDRGLKGFVSVARRVKEKIPEAKFQWCYGWKVFDVVHGESSETMKWKVDLQNEMKEVGVEELGRISHGDVAKLYNKASVFLYPSEFAEIDCISLSKAMAAGAYPITTDFAAMGEKTGHGGYFAHSKKTKENWCGNAQTDFSYQDTDEIAAEVIRYLKSPQENKEMRKWAQEQFDWSRIADVWIKEFKS